MSDNIKVPTDEQAPVGRRDLIYLFRAYNRGEITFEEWIQRTRAWRDAIFARCGRQPQGEPRAKPGAPD